MSPLKFHESESESESQGHESEYEFESLKSGLESGLGLEYSQHCIHSKKKFTTTSKTVYIYVFCLFLAELIVVKIDHVSVLGNYNKHSI